MFRKILIPLLSVTLLASAPLAAEADTPSPSPSPAASAMTLPELQAAVTELSKHADELNAALEQATLDYQNAQDALSEARASADKASAESVKASAAAAEAKEEMGQFARNSYMNPVPQQAALLSAVNGSTPTDAVKSAEYLDHIGRGTSSALSKAQDLQSKAQAASRRARLLRDAASERASSLSEKLSSLKAQAEAASAELTAQMNQLFLAEVISGISPSGAPFDPAAMTAACSSTALTPPPSSPAWGGFSNGLIPLQALCEVTPGQYLRFDAAAAFRALSAAYQSKFGTPLCISDSYRPYDTQVEVFATKPGLAATPGKSNHGWGLAVDLCGGINSYGTEQYNWMLANANSFGWFNPPWAQEGGAGPQEPWHWNFGTFN